MGSFSKAFGTVGGFICASRRIIDFLTVRRTPSSTPLRSRWPRWEAALAALELMDGTAAAESACTGTREIFRTGLKRLGLNLGDSEYQITPLMIGDETKADAFRLLYHGPQLIMLPFVYPRCQGQGASPLQVTAAHSEPIWFALEALAVIGPELESFRPGFLPARSKAKKALWLAENKLQGPRNAGLGYVAEEMTQPSEAHRLARSRLSSGG